MNLSFADFNNKKVQLLYNKTKKRHPEVKEILLKDFKAEREDIVLIDVRTARERRVSQIPKAVSRQEFEKNRSKYKGKKIVAYCTTGERSAQYIKKLQKKGVKAFNLEGSILGWVDHGGDLLDPKNQPTKKVHTYGRRWNVVPKTHKAVWNWF